MPEKVEFSGTIGTTEAVSVQRSFKGTAVMATGTRRVIEVVTVTFTITISITFLLKVVFDVDLNRLFYYAPPPQTTTPPVTQVVLPTEEPLSAKLRELGIDSYIVIVRVYENAAEAEELEYVLRQQRVYAKHLIYNSKYHVYVGPLYAKQRMNAALQSLERLGYTGAYSLYPE
ncbi:MAG: hypothetical protein ACREOO_24595 [bacterium]